MREELFLMGMLFIYWSSRSGLVDLGISCLGIGGRGYRDLGRCKRL